VIGRTTLFKTLLGLTLLGACSGCTVSGDDDEGDGGGVLLIEPLAQDAMASGLMIDKAELSLSAVALDPCMTDAALLRTLPFSFDLFQQPPASVGFMSAVTDYCGLEVDLGPEASGDLSELEGATALLHGTRPDGTQFTLTSTLATTLNFDSDVTLDAMHLVLGVDFDAWFANADLTNAQASDDGVLIDANDNPDVLAAFDAATSSAFAVYDDVNGDGKITGSELVPVATAAMP